MVAEVLTVPVISETFPKALQVEHLNTSIWLHSSSISSLFFLLFSFLKQRNSLAELSVCFPTVHTLPSAFYHPDKYESPRSYSQIVSFPSFCVFTKTLLAARWQSSGLNRRASTQLMPQGEGRVWIRLQVHCNFQKTTLG